MAINIFLSTIVSFDEITSHFHGMVFFALIPISLSSKPDHSKSFSISSSVNINCLSTLLQ